MRNISKHERTITVLFLLTILCLVLVSRSTPIRRAFAVESFYVGVYWDANGNNPVTFVDWGELSPGSTKSVGIYVRNEEFRPTCYVFLWTEDWIPDITSKYISLDWSYDGRKIAPNEIMSITLKLKVARNVLGVNNFSFNIVIFGADHVIGDINGDQSVDIFDIVEIASVYDTTPSDSEWNPQADLNEDGIINIFDITISARNYGLDY
ncbi:MAG: dockerin type I domain-containing protein [Candidatus Bathyarchaeota archaeon]|nr:dockerin type I domain-containing protein [Candidatus Bathyarchaeota archaeon]